MKEFLAFDGEGINNEDGAHEYILLANSEGRHILNRMGLDFEDCLNFLTESNDKINVWFAFGYDINMIFKNAPKELNEIVFKLGEKGTYTDKKGVGYEIEYLSRKILSIKKGDVKFTHYDVFGFFQTSFINTCKDWKIPISEDIEKGKAERSEFVKWKNEDIIKYNNAECELLIILMNKFRDKLFKNNINLLSWHGAGAIGNFMLKQLNAESFKPRQIPNEVHQFRKFATFGGRIELFQRGTFKNIHHYDINSAYPYAMLSLPNLNGGEWYYTDKPTKKDLNNFGITEVSWKTDSKIGPFPFRLKGGYVVFPNHGRGRYHNIEIRTALEKGYDITTHGGWYMKPPYTYPFKDYITSMMKKRLEYKKSKDMAHIPLKLGANSFYGKLAQKPVRYNQVMPFRELLFSGYITALTRSMLLHVAEPEDIILMATDGIFSTTPLKVDIGENLGQWEYEEHEKALFLLAGIYRLWDSKKQDWTNKLRGYKNVELEEAYNAMKTKGVYVVHDTRFVGLKYGLTQSVYAPCQFHALPRILNWNNNKKRSFIDPFDDSASYPTTDIEGLKESQMYKVRYDSEDIDINQTELDILKETESLEDI